MLILHPAYVAGKIGEICGQEDLGNPTSAVNPQADRTKQRWLVRVENENATESLVVSLFPREFEIFKNDFEPF
ncbi:hypothetical protein [Scytonema sp. UIC 10036]|uniref:hypothetical protein n=1 Tax=Scytonema sp. UIC 10036 TaxID=2304196 RepID=UPI00325BF56E